MCQVSSKTINDCNTLGKAELKPEVFYIGLWKHECERVFVDKLITTKDKDIAINFINESCIENFSQYESEILEKLCTRVIYFCDFLQPDVMDDEGNIVDEGPKVYEAIWDIPALRKRIEDLLQIYNEKFPSKKMHLVIFDDA
jgi:dynein heavy chain